MNKFSCHKKGAAPQKEQRLIDDLFMNYEQYDSLEFLLNLNLGEGLYDIAHLNVVKVN